MLYTKVSVFSIQQQYIILLQLHTTSCYTVTFIRSFCRFCLITRATLDFILDSGMKKRGIKKKKKTAHLLHPITVWRKPFCARKRLLFRQTSESIWANNGKNFMDDPYSNLVCHKICHCNKNIPRTWLFSKPLSCFQLWRFEKPIVPPLPNHEGRGPPARKIFSMSSAGNNNNNHNSNNEHFKNYSYLSRVIGYNLTDKNCSFILQSNPINQRSKTKAFNMQHLGKNTT